MKKKPAPPKSQTDCKRIKVLKDEDIDFSDIPPVPKEMFARAIMRRGLQPVPPK